MLAAEPRRQTASRFASSCRPIASPVSGPTSPMSAGICCSPVMSMSRNDLHGEMSRHDRPDRRRVLVVGSALVGAAVLPGAAGAAEAGLASAADLTARTQAFLAGLDPDKRKAASFQWDGKEWRGW